MEKSALIHKSDSIYSFPLSSNLVEIRLLTKKDDDIVKVELIYNDKYKFHESVKSKEIFKKYSDDRYDYYIERMVLTDLRFAYVFKITTIKNYVYYFSESGVTDDYDITKGFYDFFQVSYINNVDLIEPSSVIRNRVFYQIFVDRFNKSIDNNNSRINISWGDKVGRYSIAGGDIKGIIEKIDYLKDLGIDALYLTPIFESESNHKYNIKDYYSIAKDFGDEKDLENLINILHKNNMIIVLDGVFNHISKDNELFLDVIKNGNKSKYFNWFFINGDNLDLDKNNYERFADDLGMPRLNLNNREVQEYVINIGLHYIRKYNIDGFRLDVSDEIPHRFWIRFKEKMLEENPKFILIGENWHNAHRFLNDGFEFDSIMNYAITKEVLNFIAWRKYTPIEFKNRIDITDDLDEEIYLKIDKEKLHLFNLNEDSILKTNDINYVNASIVIKDNDAIINNKYIYSDYIDKCINDNYLNDFEGYISLPSNKIKFEKENDNSFELEVEVRAIDVFSDKKVYYSKLINNEESRITFFGDRKSKIKKGDIIKLYVNMDDISIYNNEYTKVCVNDNIYRPIQDVNLNKIGKDYYIKSNSKEFSKNKYFKIEKIYDLNNEMIINVENHRKEHYSFRINKDPNIFVGLLIYTKYIKK